MAYNHQSPGAWREMLEQGRVGRAYYEWVDERVSREEWYRRLWHLYNSRFDTGYYGRGTEDKWYRSRGNVATTDAGRRDMDTGESGAVYRDIAVESQHGFAYAVVSSAESKVTLTGGTVEGSDEGDLWADRFVSAHSREFSDAINSAFCRGQSAVVLDTDPAGGVRVAQFDAEDYYYYVDPLSGRIVAAWVSTTDPDFDMGLGSLFLTDPDGRHWHYRYERSGHSGATSEGWEEKAVVELGFFPFFVLRNKDGMGEFERAVPVLHRLRTSIGDRLHTQELQAFLQRAVSGNFPRTDEKGEPIDYSREFRTGPDALWMMPEGAEVHEGRVVDLNPLLGSAKSDLHELAAVTETAIPSLFPDMANQTSEGAKAATRTAKEKAVDRIARFTPVFGEVLTAARRWETGKDVEVAPTWAPVEDVPMAEKAEGAQMMLSSLPHEEVLVRAFGYPSSRATALARRWEVQRRARELGSLVQGVARRVGGGS